MKKGLKSHLDEDKDPEFPDHYDLIKKVKPTLQCLHYNVRFLWEDNYRAKMPDDFARDMILMYSKEGDHVWDGCCGSGTVPIIAAKNDRFGFGTDVNPKAVELAKKKAESKNVPAKTYFDVADAREAEFAGRQMDLIISSLPFGLNIAGDYNHYSEEAKDISNSENYEQFFKGAEDILRSYFKNLKGAGVLVIDARDRTLKGEYYDVINYFRNSALNVGFKMLGRYYYQLIPYRLFGSKNKVTKMPIPLVDAVDVNVFYKPENTRLDDVL